jgi:hypothetical protein
MEEIISLLDLLNESLPIAGAEWDIVRVHHGRNQTVHMSKPSFTISGLFNNQLALFPM